PEEESLFTPVKSHTRKETGRKPFPDYFPRIEMLHDIPESEKICSCGHELTRIGEEKSEKLDIHSRKSSGRSFMFVQSMLVGTVKELRMKLFPLSRLLPFPIKFLHKIAVLRPSQS
ncbi:helix-turn-helix domain of transposase IS66 protein, partial [Leptospira interrogans serovar Bataviae str. HAI135]